MSKALAIFALFLGLVALVVAPGCKNDVADLSWMDDPSLTREERQAAWASQMQEWLSQPIDRDAAISNAVEAYWEHGGEAVLARPHGHRVKKDKSKGIWVVIVDGRMPDGSGGWVKRKARCEVPFERIDQLEVDSYKNVTKFELLEPGKESE